MASSMTAPALANEVMLQRRTCAALVLWRDVHASSRVSGPILFGFVTTYQRYIAVQHAKRCNGGRFFPLRAKFRIAAQ
jgi:hypothetical protein